MGSRRGAVTAEQETLCHSASTAALKLAEAGATGDVPHSKPYSSWADCDGNTLGCNYSDPKPSICFCARGIPAACRTPAVSRGTSPRERQCRSTRACTQRSPAYAPPPAASFAPCAAPHKAGEHLCVPGLQQILLHQDLFWSFQTIFFLIFPCKLSSFVLAASCWGLPKSCTAAKPRSRPPGAVQSAPCTFTPCLPRR